MAAKAALVVREDGREEEIPLDDVQLGDRLRVRPGAHPALRRQGGGPVRARRDPGCGLRVHRLGDMGPRTLALLRAAGGGCRPDHRVSVCSGPGDPHVDHDGDRPRRSDGGAHQECRIPGAVRSGRHAHRRQDRYVDEGGARARGRPARNRPRRGHGTEAGCDSGEGLHPRGARGASSARLSNNHGHRRQRAHCKGGGGPPGHRRYPRRRAAGGQGPHHRATFARTCSSPWPTTPRACRWRPGCSFRSSASSSARCSRPSR